jgi:hypothetical protein
MCVDEVFIRFVFLHHLKQCLTGVPVGVKPDTFHRRACFEAFESYRICISGLVGYLPSAKRYVLNRSVGLFRHTDLPL